MFMEIILIFLDVYTKGVTCIFFVGFFTQLNPKKLTNLSS